MFVQFFDLTDREYWIIGVGRLRLGWYIHSERRNFTLWIVQ